MVKNFFISRLFLRKENSKKKIIDKKQEILNYLNDLKAQEARLWGVLVNDISAGEEKNLANSNHLIYLLNHKKPENLSNLLKLKDVKNFLSDILELRKDFLLLKKNIKHKDRLKLLISNFTIQLVSANNYDKFKDVFLVEKQLYEVLDRQEKDFDELIKDIGKIGYIKNDEQKVETFILYLKDLRRLLAGHLDNLKYFEEERFHYSNTSNIIDKLIKIFQQDVD